MSPKTADFIEATKAQTEGIEKPAKRHKSGFRGPSPDVGKATQFKKGQPSANPSGRPKRDIAADIARAVFETSEAEAIQAFRHALLKGNAYTFKELAERGYGKLKEVHEVKHVHEDVADADLQERIDAILRDIGLARAVDEAGGIEVTAGRAEKANGKAKDTPVLS